MRQAIYCEQSARLIPIRATQTRWKRKLISIMFSTYLFIINYIILCFLIDFQVLAGERRRDQKDPVRAEQLAQLRPPPITSDATLGSDERVQTKLSRFFCFGCERNGEFFVEKYFKINAHRKIYEYLFRVLHSIPYSRYIATISLQLLANHFVGKGDQITHVAKMCPNYSSWLFLDIVTKQKY